MSVICYESDEEIPFGEALYAGRQERAFRIFALSQKVLGKIPPAERRARRCSSGDYGIDIFGATAGKNLHGNYSMDRFRLGKFRFSISRETAEKYLPKRFGRSHTTKRAA